MAKAATNTSGVEDIVTERPAEGVGRGLLKVKMGRGRTGKTTHARWEIERAQDAGRTVLIGDGDRTNRTISSFYADSPYLRAPLAADEFTMKTWLEEVTVEAIDSQSRLILDMGGGDRIFANVSEKHEFIKVLPENGVDIVAEYFLTGGRDDYEVLVFMEEIGFQPQRTVIVLNEGQAPAAAARQDPFAKALEAKPIKAVMERGAKVLRMPAVDLDTMVAADDLFVGIRAASLGRVPLGEDGQPVPSYKPLNLWKRTELKRWLEEMERRHQAAGIAEWLV